MDHADFAQLLIEKMKDIQEECFEEIDDEVVAGGVAVILSHCMNEMGAESINLGSVKLTLTEE
ncbi:MAG: hypothetical protein GY782_07850 [Gammaproteobacteria bacterium]|nr:hypothetical protein [Gammaproteobacteria bacterium]